MEKEFIIKIGDLGKEHTKIAGGKGANLGELSKRVVVPSGFVVLNSSFKNFILYNNLPNLVQELQKNPSIELTQKISEKILKGSFPKPLELEILEKLYPLKNNFFAVRSSAVFEDSKEASWAGQLETFTNIKQNNILEHVKKCWASLFSQRAINYYQNQKQKQALEMAVVVQEMVNSEKSGICFTANPVTKNHDEILIEAGFGLGEHIVGGQITPDLYIVDKKTLKVKSVKVNLQEKMLCIKNGKTIETDLPYEMRKKQKLSLSEIKKIAKQARSIEKHYNYPQDTEWAIKEDKLLFLQTRPITTI